MVAQDDWRHPDTGERWHFDNRIWLIRRGETARPLFPQPPRIGHEWWDPDGRHIWYLHFAGSGTQKVELATGCVTVVWPGGCGHSHADVTGSLLVGDNPRRDRENRTQAFDVSFYNASTDREAHIAASLPVLAIDRYHGHPHPQFCPGDRWIAYTTTALGQIDVAFVDVRELVAATG